MCTFDDDCDDGHGDDGDYDKDAKCIHADACDRVFHDQGVCQHHFWCMLV